MVFDKELAESIDHSQEITMNNLMTIISDNKDTVFGKEHGFSAITDFDSYRRNVPLSDYRDYSGYIGRMMNGEENVLTVYDILGYCRTSGTTGEPKYIPVSAKEFVNYSNYFERLQDKLIDSKGGKRLFINTFRATPGKKAEQPLLFSEHYYQYLADHSLLDEDTYAGGMDLLFDDEPGDVMFAKAWTGIAEENIIAVESIFLYDQLNFFSYLTENCGMIIDSMRRRRIPDDIILSDKIKAKLLSMDIREERLDEAEAEFRKGSDNIAKRLWKGLFLICGISNRSFFTEDLALEQFAGDVQKFYLCYCASECYFGYPCGINSFSYVMMPKNAFFEFLPYSENENAETAATVLPHELETGKLYEVVITNFAGLYRYRMGDIVKASGFYAKCPVMEFMFRRNQAINIAGEKMSVMQLEAVMNELPEHGIFPKQYCFGSSTEKLPAKYLAAIVTGKNTAKDGEVSDILDRLLRKYNRDYDDLRNMNSIARVRAVILSDSDYELFLTENGMKGGHNKPKHIAFDGFSERRFNKWIRTP